MAHWIQLNLRNHHQQSLPETSSIGIVAFSQPQKAQPVSTKPTTAKTKIAASTPAAKAIIHASVFDALPDSAYIRQAQLLQNPKHPEVAAPIPFSAATFWRKVKEGAFPAPVKLGARITAWKVGDVRAWLAQQTA